MNLTQEEKAVVTSYLNADPSLLGAVKEYWPILIPTFALEVYGLVSSDTVASGLGFALLLGFMIWFLQQGGKAGVLLKNALQKYESAVSAMK